MGAGRETAVDAAVPWRVRDAALLFALGVGTLLLIAVAALGLYHLQGPPTTVPPQPPSVLAAVATDLFYLVILAGVWFFVVRRYDAPWRLLGLRWPDRSTLLPVLVLFAILAALSIVVTAGMTLGLGALGVRAAVTPLTNVPAPDEPLFWPVVVGSLILAPVAEELLFRGVLYQSLRKQVGVGLGIATSAVLFAVLHLQLAMVPEFLVLGIILAAAFERTRSLYPPMLMHAAYNGVIILLAMRVI